MTTNAFLLKQPFFHPVVIFKSVVTLIILSTGFLVHSQIFEDSYKDCGVGEGGEVGYFWCKSGHRMNLFALVLYCYSVKLIFLTCCFLAYHRLTYAK